MRSSLHRSNRRDYKRQLLKGSEHVHVHGLADKPHPLALLRMRRERPCCCRAPSAPRNSRRLMGFPLVPRPAQVEAITFRENALCASQQIRRRNVSVGSSATWSAHTENRLMSASLRKPPNRKVARSQFQTSSCCRLFRVAVRCRRPTSISLPRLKRLQPLGCSYTSTRSS